MPERPQPIPEEFGAEEPIERPRLRKVYDADEELKKERLRGATGGLKRALSEEGRKERVEEEMRKRLDKISEGWGEIEKEERLKQKTKTAVSGLKELLSKKEEKIEPSEVEERGVTPEPSAGEELFEKGLPADFQDQRLIESIERATQDSAERLRGLEQQIEGNFGIDMSGLTPPSARKLEEVRKTDPALLDRYYQERQEYEAWLEQCGKYGITGPSLEDTLEEIPVYKPDYTPPEQKFFKEGEAMSEANEEAWKDITFEPGKPSSELAPKPSPGIHGKEYQIANALQEAAYLVGYTARMIAQRFPGIDLETKTLGIIFGHLRFRRARETMPDLFDRYEAEDREYKRLLSEADKYGMLSGRAGTKRISHRKETQMLNPIKIPGISG